MSETREKAIEIYEKKLIKSILTSIGQHGGNDCLSSIILTGSVGRGEPTYTLDEGGRVILKSDVEIVLVFPKPSKKKAVEKLISEVSAEFKEELNLMAVNEKRVRKANNFNFTLRVPKYKTIFTYDLYNGSKTIWGHDFIKSKEIRLSDIDPYEAKRLVGNRIGELVYLQNYKAASEQNDFLRKQWKGKLALAIASAWLICEGEYISSYHGQYQKIKEKKSYVEHALGKSFFEEYDQVFHFLREDGAVYEISDENMIRYVKYMDFYFRKCKFKKPKINSLSRIIKYVIKYAKTGMKYGVVGFENNILQALIYHYWNQSDGLIRDADVWHSVLY